MTAPDDGAGVPPWRQYDPASGDWDLELLERRVAALGDNGTGSVVVVHRGALVHERHWGPDGAAQVDDVASVQKSVVGLLVGIAWDRGLLHVDDPVSDHLGPGWSRAGAGHESAVTIRHLLSMTSGLSPTLGHASAPGDSWSYNTLAYQMLKPVLAAAAGVGFEELTRRWLVDPVGLCHTSWVRREPLSLPEGTPDGVRVALMGQGFEQDSDGRWAHRMPNGELVTGLCATARDLARVGSLIVGGGRVGDRQVVSERFLQAATRPSQPHNPAYGWLFWLNGQPGATADGIAFSRLQPDAPDDLVAARGANQQLLDCSASAGLVLARTSLGAASAGLGHAPVAARIWSAILAARR